MTIGRWLLIGLPLVVMGAVWLYCGVLFEDKLPEMAFLGAVGGAYLLSGLVAAFDKTWCRGVARIAWYPLLLIIPIGTVFGIMALRLLRDDPETVRRFHKDVKALSSDEIASIIRREAFSRFGLQETQLGDSLVGKLRIAPGEVSGFIDDLETDYGFDLADSVSVAKASINDIITTLS